MRKKKWWFPTAYSCWGEEEHEAIRRVIASGNFTMGEEVERFEEEFARFHGVKHAVMVNSGSSANLLAVAALYDLGILDNSKRGGTRVLVPAIAWPTTYAPFIQHGAVPWVSDCDNSWNASECEGAEDCDAVVACSILGNPAHLKDWREWCGQKGAVLIEDNCESLGARIDDKLCGTFGHVGTFSFFYSHQISAIEGGMLVTDEDDIAERARILRNHGWRKYDQSHFASEYDFVTFGYNIRGLELHAAVASEQLKKLPMFNVNRRANYFFFRKLVSSLPIAFQEIEASSYINPFGIAFQLPTHDIRLKVVNALREAGIDCRPPTGGSFLRHHYGQRWRSAFLTPHADNLHDTALFIGNAPFKIEEQLVKAVQIIAGVFNA